ncbi:MAG: cell division protein ZapA [Clostridiales bacterium]|nr:cell division protein ZapA [Clostridiales bacterium]
MKNKVTVTVAGRNYILSSADNTAYVEKVAAYVDAQMSELQRDSRASALDVAVMTALNVADNYYHAVASNEDLRRQLKEALDEKGKLDSQLSEAKREIVRLQLGKK